MENSTELRPVVYSLLLTQIQFGAYRGGERLPTMEETSSQLCVSVDTVRAAYLALKEQGVISLSKNIGATVKVRYDAQETEHFIQSFFSARRHAMIDLGSSLLPLFGNAQWIGLKHASPQTLRAMEALWRSENTAAPYAMLEHLNEKYSALGNSLFMRLVWQSFTFLYAPFFSIEENLLACDPGADYVPSVLAHCRQGDWPALRAAVTQSIEGIARALNQFYQERITLPSPQREIPFRWSSYKKSQQRCYTLAMDLLIAISRGEYPSGSILPSQKALAQRAGLSISTVRRALELLGSVGAIQSTPYVGTRVLPLEKIAENSDFANPILRRRLLDMAESFQALALSCREVSRLTLASLDTGAVGQLRRELEGHQQTRRGEALFYFTMAWIAKNAPYQAIRTVYSELLRQFFWAYAFRALIGVDARYDLYADALIAALRDLDFARFSETLEEFALHALGETVKLLSQLGIPGAENLLVPEPGER